LPKRTETIRISFNPNIYDAKISTKVQESLYIRYNGHPKNQKLDVFAEFCYPNIKLEKSEIDFGTVMNDTSKKQTLKIFNDSEINVQYEWFFLEDENHRDVKVNEVFDILPLRGVIEPGVSEYVDFTYYAVPFNSFNITAICRVTGGPDYFVKINAEASDVAYQIHLSKEKNFVDLGQVFLGQVINQEIVLENTSKVPFEYSVRLDLSSDKAQYMKNFIQILPS
jgi:hydrocephalus-inducing protein